MAKRSKTKKQKQPDTAAVARRERDAAYREALGVTDGEKLPGTIGTTSTAGGGRDRRSKVAGLGESKKANRGSTGGRARLIG